MTKTPKKPARPPKVTNWHRAWWGVFAALSAIGLKLLTQDLYWFLIAHDTRDAGKFNGMLITYLITLVVLGFVGAGVAVASREKLPAKLIAIAIAAPAMFTTASGGAKSDKSSILSVISQLMSPVSVAYAADRDSDPSESSIIDGVKLFFGVGKDESRYRVVVGSFKNRTEAAQFVEKIKKEDPKITAFVGEAKPNNPFSPVIIGGYLAYPQAKKLRDDVMQLNAVKEVKDVYLSPYEFR